MATEQRQQIYEVGLAVVQLDVTQTLRDLPCTRELHIVEESGECKEILALIDFTPSTPLSDIKIIIDRFSGNRYHDFAFTQAEEAAGADAPDGSAEDGESGEAAEEEDGGDD